MNNHLLINWVTIDEVNEPIPETNIVMGIYRDTGFWFRFDNIEYMAESGYRIVCHRSGIRPMFPIVPFEELRDVIINYDDKTYTESKLPELYKDYRIKSAIKAIEEL